MLFPSFVAFSAQIKGREVYMTCTPYSGKRVGFLMLNQQTAEVPSLSARFVVERVRDSDLVHIRSCYRNHYLSRTTTSGFYITVSESKPVEDKKAVNCTLFRVKDMGSSIATFTHVQSGYEVSREPDTDALPLHNIVIGTKALRLKVVDYGMLAKLPKRVIFKGDNGQYLRCCRKEPRPIFTPEGPVDEESHEYNEFTSKDGSDRSSHYEITHHNGTIRVKSLQFGKFLRRSDDEVRYNSWIWGDSDDTTNNNADTLFVVENLGNNVIALRNLGNNKVCRRLSADRLDNCLRATETYVVSEARLAVEEPVSYRKIMAEYKLADARITSQTLEYHSKQEHENKYKDKGDDQIELSITYKQIRNTKWSTSTTSTNNFNAKIDIGLPKYVKGEILLQGKIEEIKHFEEGSYSSVEVKARTLAKVPPMTKVILKGYILKATYDVPCSYIQSNVYTNGEKDTTVVEDGVCQGFESYGYHFEKECIPL